MKLLDHPVVAATRRFLEELPRFHGGGGPESPHLLAAFSGGTDSCALLAALATLRDGGCCRVDAAHLDHGADSGSALRASSAARVAGQLRVPLLTRRIAVSATRRVGESWEAAARRVRYDFLESARNESGAGWVATAHHADDQTETILLRLSQGTGLWGLAAIRRTTGRVVRPLLEMRRRDLVDFCMKSGLSPCDDPGNRDPAFSRSRLRHFVMPHLLGGEQGSDEFVQAACRLASRASRALAALELAALRVSGAESFADELVAQPLSRLPPAIGALALQAKRRRLRRQPGSGAATEELTTSRRAFEELRRQLADRGTRSAKVSLSARHVARQQSGRVLVEEVRREVRAEFSYKLSAPGELWIPELSACLHLKRVEGLSSPPSPRALRVHLAVTGGPGIATAGGASTAGSLGTELLSTEFTVRSRRPGDRFRPLGSPGRRPLKKVLADARIPPSDRWRIPLLCAARPGATSADGEPILWVPGVAVAEECRFQIARLRNAGEPAADMQRNTAGPAAVFWEAELVWGQPDQPPPPGRKRQARAGDLRAAGPTSRSRRTQIAQTDRPESETNSFSSA